MSNKRDFKENIKNLKVKVEESKLTNEYSKKALESLLTSLKEVIDSMFDNEAAPMQKIKNLEENVKDLLEKKIQFANPDLEKSLESLLQPFAKFMEPLSEDETKVTQQREKFLETVKTLVENITCLFIERLLYHVTNQPENGDDVSFEERCIKAFKKNYGSKYHPNLPIIDDSELSAPTNPNQLASRILTMNINTDGKREFLKCAFLSSTFYNNKLPTTTPYPTDGEKGTKYKRIIIPFETIIDNYPICWFWCAVGGQVHYICGKECDEEKIEKSIFKGYKEKDMSNIKLNKLINEKKDFIKNYQKISESDAIIDEGGDKIIYKSKTDYVLPRIQNNYFRDSESVYKVFYNIAVCGDIPLTTNTKNNQPSKNGDYKVDSVKKTE